MAGRSKNPYSEYEMLRAFQTVLGDLESEQEVRTSVEILPGPSLGIVTVLISAWGQDERRGSRPLARVRFEYPNARDSILAAQMFAQATTLSRMVSEALRQTADY